MGCTVTNKRGGREAERVEGKENGAGRGQVEHCLSEQEAK